MRGNSTLRVFTAGLTMFLSIALAQDVSTVTSEIEGQVRDSDGRSVEGVAVLLQSLNGPGSTKAESNAEGVFRVSGTPGNYTIKLGKAGFQDLVESSLELVPGEKKHCDFVLRRLHESASAAKTGTSPTGGIELDDRPSFTVAGITDSTGSGGHGSETRMRTGEALAKETVNLSAGDHTLESATTSGLGAGPEPSESSLRAALEKNPQSFGANRQLGKFYFDSGQYRRALPILEAAYKLNPQDFANALDLGLAYKACGEFVEAREHVEQMLAGKKEPGKQDEASLHRLLGEVDERLNDPLGAVHEYERAAELDGSEQNYFSWGAELLLHKAAAPAIEVFGKGSRQHPNSARMLAGLGAALYTSGSIEEGAQRLCQASDLEPGNSAPYLFLGKIQQASSAPLPCAEQKLQGFAQDNPENALANFYYALALARRNGGSADPGTSQKAEVLFRKSSAIDPKLDVAYLELGNLYSSQGDLQQAIAAYQNAITANPTGSDAHYRLGLAYKRIGDEEKAKNEFDEYKQLEKNQAAVVEKQRRELRQFLFVLNEHPSSQTVSNPKPPEVTK
jgi:tetratricopeptide (TPR) repeat protein